LRDGEFNCPRFAITRMNKHEQKMNMQTKLKRFVTGSSLEVDFPISPDDEDDVRRSSICDGCIEQEHSLFLFKINWHDSV
jgi:hypothetical protein